jgi:hypothetical protein
MESERLYINNKLIELSTQTQQFARTLQVNDILSLMIDRLILTKNIRIARTPTVQQKTHKDTSNLWPYFIRLNTQIR